MVYIVKAVSVEAMVKILEGGKRISKDSVVRESKCHSIPGSFLVADMADVYSFGKWLVKLVILMSLPHRQCYP